MRSGNSRRRYIPITVVNGVTAEVGPATPKAGPRPTGWPQSSLWDEVHTCLALLIFWHAPPMLEDPTCKILATLVRLEAAIRQDESDPKDFPAHCGRTFDKLEQEVASWVY
jgi:hypothetical protein